MKNINIAVLAALTLLVSCNEYRKLRDVDPVGNSSYLHGRLVLTDTLTQRAIVKPLAKKTVTVNFSDATDQVNYLYSTVTDDNGYFKFDQLAEKHTYTVSYSEVVDNKMYQAISTPIKLPQESKDLVARLAPDNQFGVIFDVADGNGQRIGNADVCIFTSPVTSTKNTCEGSNISLKSDAYGNASFFRLSGREYYVVSRAMINGVENVAHSQIAIGQGIIYEHIKLKPVVVPILNTRAITVADLAGNAIANAQVCLFTSKSLFARDTCEASNYSLVTNAAGKGTFSDLLPGKYYVLAILSLKGFRLAARDSIIVEDKVQGAPLPLILK